jgi:hypothetical protein
MQIELIQRFHAALPKVREWIEEFLANYADQARAVSTLRFERLSACFPQDILERAKVVTVSRVPFPPVSRFGLPEFAAHEQQSFAGITFLDTFFLQRGQSSESLHFHEMVHIVQWARLGPDNFLLAYGVGLAKFGYKQSPLERMAYDLQDEFEKGTLPERLVSLIRERTNDIWNQVGALLKAEGGDTQQHQADGR